MDANVLDGDVRRTRELCGDLDLSESRVSCDGDVESISEVKLFGLQY